MALKTETISSIQPFWHIDCPVCGGDDFTEYGSGGGVYCDRCNVRFSVRQTAGDPGCVVDAHFDDVSNVLALDSTQYGWRKVLFQMGCFRRIHGTEKEPIVQAYRIMKEPGETGTYCTDDRGWILSLRGRVLDKDIPKIVGSKRYTHLKGPIVGKTHAIAVFADLSLPLPK